MRRLAFAVALSSLCACGHNVKTAFPAGIAPMEENTASDPKAEGSDQYPEEMVAVQDSTDNYDFVHARAYIHAPMAKVFAALQVPGVVTDRRKLETWTVTQNVETGYEVSFRVHAKTK